MNIIEYFKNEWKPDYSKFKHSGWKLLKQIDIRESILDVGCGYNLFKPYFPNLYGIDPANDKADQIISIEDFKSNKKFDVILCLGSINFGSYETIDMQVKKVVSLLKQKGRIYWRQNPGIGDHPWKGVENITFFPWSKEYNYILANKYNCTVKKILNDNTRIYAEWLKD